jgi:integral membrane sensor domain MASE1
LAYGYHNVTVYATDKLGNIGASETIYFNVEKPPTALIAFVVIIVAVVSVGLGLIVYFKKRKH